MTFQQIQAGQPKANAPALFLERDLLALSIEERFLASAQRIVDKESINGAGDKSLRHHQIPAFLNFGDYLMDIATSPKEESISPFCRIVLPPRTGKTVIGAKIIEWTGLCSTFIVPTKALVFQTFKELRSQMPEIPIGLYYGEKKQPVDHGVNITTYATLQRHFFSGKLPQAIRSSALIFLDEGHHAMTSSRVETIHKAFENKAIRIAVTATPDYNQSKQLHHFFPVLIHELELFDAFELGLLAPARMWAIEVDADASTVRFVAGDYEQKTLGRLMSSSPFFKAVQVFRYEKSNIKIPALITCSSRQQAYDLWTFLKKHKPQDRPLPGLILGDTSKKERERVLANFECGVVDTLVQVGVLIEGWNSPRCKLLLDLAPSLSRVRATQKYFRVMTRYQEKEARIVVILPKYLPRQPILPIDLILKLGENYFCGDLINSSHKNAANTRKSVDITAKSPIRSVKIKTRVIASASLIKPNLDPDNLNQIRQVLASCPAFSLSLTFGSLGFRRLFFNHPLFVGTGSTLLRYLGIPNGQSEYFSLMAKLFPEELGSLILVRNGGTGHEIADGCLQDFQYIKQAALAPNNKRGKPQEPFTSTLNALCGGCREIASAEEVLMIQEQIRQIYKFLPELDPRQQQIVIHRLGLFGTSDCTWNELSLVFDISRERVRQIFKAATRKLASKYFRRIRDRRPITKAVFEYPDLSEIYFGDYT
jgi:hypothetical protein